MWRDLIAGAKRFDAVKPGHRGVLKQPKDVHQLALLARVIASLRSSGFRPGPVGSAQG